MPSDECGSGNVVVSWTGGKDGCYACYRAMAAGCRVTHLLHFRNPDRPGSHEINPAVVRAQADALGIPLLQRDAPAYEPAFKEAVRELRAGGERIDGAVFGHIGTHRPLAERVCRDLELDLLLPLWQEESGRIIAGIVDAGFVAIVASARDGPMGKEWLGRRIDRDFVRDLAGLDGATDPCGENGEFHTLVTDGPIFSRRIEITGAERVLRDGYWFLDIREFACRKKRW
jgi:uncharacterized protein (TIGR00290 family)